MMRFVFFNVRLKKVIRNLTIGPTCKLQNRLLFHLSHKFNDEKRLMGFHQNLQDVIEDQVSKNTQIALVSVDSLFAITLSRIN